MLEFIFFPCIEENCQKQKLEMNELFLLTLIAFGVGICAAVDPHEHNKIVCYWNSTSFNRPGNYL